MFGMKRRSVSALMMSIAALAQAAAAQTATAPSVPANLQVPSGNAPFVRGYAEGTQNYVCLPGEAGLAWRFQGPQATVFLTLRWINGEIRQQMMTHFLSPSVAEEGAPARATWQSSLDTSAVWAKRIADSSDPAYVAPGAIPWFLLQVTGTKAGPAGGQLLTRTSYIQRVNTAGGVMPQGVCSEVGVIRFVPYTAEYVFYEPVRQR
ncbi:MAG TPA: hypothetical protein DEH78_29200 [Solibacterales bacterium]|nr:hypothetical protein [Bryobacterales bacterium]